MQPDDRGIVLVNDGYVVVGARGTTRFPKGMMANSHGTNQIMNGEKSQRE